MADTDDIRSIVTTQFKQHSLSYEFARQSAVRDLMAVLTKTGFSPSDALSISKAIEKVVEVNMPDYALRIPTLDERDKDIFRDG